MNLAEMPRGHAIYHDFVTADDDLDCLAEPLVALKITHSPDLHSAFFGRKSLYTVHS